MSRSISVVNQSSLVGSDSLARMVAAVEVQVSRDFCPAYGLLAPTFQPVTAPAIPQSASAEIVYLIDDLDHPGAYGYHSELSGRPYGRVGVRAVLAAPGGSLLSGPNSVSATLSHEVLELVADPTVAVWVGDGPVAAWTDAAGNAHSGDEYGYEVCDPVEADCYEIDGVSVSNFVTPQWFDAGLAPGPGVSFDHMARLTRPFSLTPGGYAIVRESGAQGEVLGSPTASTAATAIPQPPQPPTQAPTRAVTLSGSRTLIGSYLASLDAGTHALLGPTPPLSHRLISKLRPGSRTHRRGVRSF